MALKKTNLVIVATPLPADFRGSPQVLFEKIVERLDIQSPSGTNFFVVGDVEPSSNVGPWLKGGTQWWVFSTSAGRYVPLDISESETPPAFIGPNDPGEPGEGDPQIWIRTAQDRIAGLYGWTGTEWKAQSGIINSGSTANRPTVPVDFERYWDTDINVEIQWERGAWRTVSGTPGDVKMVTDTVLSLALTKNPGWAVLGESDQSIRGRFVGMAAKDPGVSPESSFPTDSGITARAAGEKAGEETHILTSAEHEAHTHLMGIKTALAGSTTIKLHRADDGDDITIPSPAPPNFIQSGGNFSKQTGSTGDGATGTALITTRQLTLVNEPNYTTIAAAHNNTPAALFLWHLVKQ